MKHKWILITFFMLLLTFAAACGSTDAADSNAPAPAEEVESAPADDNTGEEAAQEDMGGESAEASEASDAEMPADQASEYDTIFPLPDDVQNFTGGGDDVNFATNLSLEEAIDFYRSAFADMGLTERELNTSITDATFSMVFDGHESGKAVVIQGVDLGNGTTNINIRLEDV